MAARTGQQYIEALRKMTPTIYLDGRRVEDVTAELVFKGPVEAIAQLYDSQHDPGYRDFALFESPASGETVSRSFQSR